MTPVYAQPGARGDDEDGVSTPAHRRPLASGAEPVGYASVTRRTRGSRHDSGSPLDNSKKHALLAHREEIAPRRWRIKGARAAHPGITARSAERLTDAALDRGSPGLRGGAGQETLTSWAGLRAW